MKCGKEKTFYLDSILQLGIRSTTSYFWMTIYSWTGHFADGTYQFEDLVIRCTLVFRISSKCQLYFPYYVISRICISRLLKWRTPFTN